MEIKPIAYIRTDLPSKFGVPRQSGLIEELEATIIFEPEYRIDEALRGIEKYSHLWLIWEFSQNRQGSWSPTVRPPRLGGNTRLGVFATRSPFRPNSLGLSCVKLNSVTKTADKGSVLLVSGADLADMTPIYDIKPYLPMSDRIEEAFGGLSERDTGLLEVIIPEEAAELFDEKRLAALRRVLELDPRPAYHDDPERVYGFPFAGFEIKFTVNGKTLTVIKAEKA
ncbi:MAG: tRNA (N6-threonylcarbamoyladenosine(37)-N6)-methyltransferase TrmO [Ruminococcus sp.]|nr:tRNA (N6-threonylcarbamoyladenosine(37)-N6)-methyltransferase TrmO [Ruminococcus sp.]